MHYKITNFFKKFINEYGSSIKYLCTSKYSSEKDKILRKNFPWVPNIKIYSCKSYYQKLSDDLKLFTQEYAEERIIKAKSEAIEITLCPIFVTFMGWLLSSMINNKLDGEYMCILHILLILVNILFMIKLSFYNLLYGLGFLIPYILCNLITYKYNFQINISVIQIDIVGLVITIVFNTIFKFKLLNLEINFLSTYKQRILPKLK